MRIDSNLVNASQKAWDEQFFHGKVPLKVALNKVAKQMQRMVDAGYAISDIKDQLNDWWGLNDKDEKVTEAMIRRALALIKKRDSDKKKTEKAKTGKATEATPSDTTSDKTQDDKVASKTADVSKKKDEKPASQKPEKHDADTTAGNKDGNAEKHSQSQALNLSRVVVEWRENEKQVIISETKPIQSGTLIRVPSGGKARVTMCKPIEYGPMLSKRSGLAVMYEPVADESAQNHGA